MEVEFEDEGLRELEDRNSRSGDYSLEVLRGFRKVMRVIRSANDERDFRAMRSLNFEKLKGDRLAQYSFRINRQWRLIVTIDAGDESKKLVRIIEIVDYH